MKLLTQTKFFIAILALGLATSGTAQVAGPFAPTEAMDTLNAGSATGGLDAGTYIGRAEAAAGGGQPAPGGNPFGAPAGGAGDPFGDAAPAGDPFGQPAGDPFGQPGGDPFGQAQDDPFAGEAGAVQVGAVQRPGQQQGPPLPPIPAKSRVLSGERIYCAVTGKILQDAQWYFVWQSDAQQNFYDDGTHGDPQAGDKYFSNITTRNDLVAPQVWRTFRQTKKMIRSAEEKDPLSFFGLSAVTTDPDSRLPQYIDKERERDQRIREWNKNFLRPYRVNPDDVESEFYKPYIPSPPSPPDVDVPPGFAAPTRATGFGDAAGAPVGSFDEFLDTAGGLQRDSVTSIPANPAASSNYYSTTAVQGGELAAGTK
jgi:hypothetical protein